MRIHFAKRKTWIAIALLFALSIVVTAHASTSRTLVVMGDSLSAAYGLKPEQGWVALLANRLQTHAPHWKVVNASVSGETTGGGAGRFARTLREHTPAVVILELGANDALRGLPLEPAQANLQRMIDDAHAINAKVLLVGIEIPPNYGPDYADAFRQMYADLAAKNQVAFLPFLLEPIAADLAHFLPDTVHPNADAQPLVLDHVWPALQPLLD